MELLKEQTYLEEGREKHVPVITVAGNTVTVKVGSVPHPMLDNHYIEFIQLLQRDRVLETKRLYPGDAPEAEFKFSESLLPFTKGEAGRGLTARAYCNLHGLWKK